MTPPDPQSLIGQLNGLLEKVTPIRKEDSWVVRHKNGQESYQLIGDPCGFPVATFGDHADMAFDLGCRLFLPQLLALAEQGAEARRAAIEECAAYVEAQANQAQNLYDLISVQSNLPIAEPTFSCTGLQAMADALRSFITSDERPLTTEEQAMIDAAWERHKAAAPRSEKEEG